MTSEDHRPPTEDRTSFKEQQILTLRFTGRNEDETALQELRAEHVSDVLEGISELVQDFDKAGAFHNMGPTSRDLFVRPAKEGSFIIELVQIVVNSPLAEAAAENPWEVSTALGLPSVSTIIWSATRIFRDQLKDFEYLDNGNVKVLWRDDTASELTPAVWEELNKRSRRRKKQLCKIMRPMDDARVNELEATSSVDRDNDPKVKLTRQDYDVVKPSEEETEAFDIFDIQGQLSAIDFDDPDRWKIKTRIATRVATVEDEAFLEEVAHGLNLNKTDTYDLKIREDRVTKNGRTATKWTILKIQKEGESHDTERSEPD